jgi:hypothetical protein
MKTVIRYSALAFALHFSPSVSAGAGDDCHFHGNQAAQPATVLKCADQRKKKLIARGKLDASWAAIQHESISMVDGQKGKEWKIVYKHATIADTSKTHLYLFFSEPGNFIAANHSGK